jgi:hypothetical protein
LLFRGYFFVKSTLLHIISKQTRRKLIMPT